MFEYLWWQSVLTDDFKQSLELKDRPKERK